jgi:hypothetical protein
MDISMKFSAKEDINCPIEDAFKVLADFETIERSAIRRGVQVRRTGGAGAPEGGRKWDIVVECRGTEREAEMELVEFDPPNAMRFSATSAGIVVKAGVELVALSTGTTRLQMDSVLEPKNLTARLLVQSLKLAKATLDRKYEQRVGAFARRVELVARGVA